MKIEVYGQNHSPWVQATLLGLHHKQLDYTLQTATPLTVFREKGVMMPAARFDGGPWEYESGDHLQRIGYDGIAPEDLTMIRGAWQGVMHRPDSSLGFFNAFSRAGDPSRNPLRRLVQNLLRSYSTFYFFTLIKGFVLRSGHTDPEDWAEPFLGWEARIGETEQPFLDGDEPGATDIILFGIIQCHCSIPVPPLNALRFDPRLENFRAWLGRMHEAFSGYPYLYSARYFEPAVTVPQDAGLLDRLAFYLGAGVLFLLFPVTVPFARYQASQVRR